jgi:hypothetical protein
LRWLFSSRGFFLLLRDSLRLGSWFLLNRFRLYVLLNNLFDLLNLLHVSFLLVLFDLVVLLIGLLMVLRVLNWRMLAMVLRKALLQLVILSL